MEAGEERKPEFIFINEDFREEPKEKSRHQRQFPVSFCGEY
jgi:hypothetical protein